MKLELPGSWRPLVAALLVALLAPSAPAQPATAPVPVPARAHAPPADGTRPGYLLVMGTVTDRAALARYGATLGPIYAQYGGRPIAIGAVGGKVRVLEGEFAHQSIVLSRFASDRWAECVLVEPRVPAQRRVAPRRRTLHRAATRGCAG